MTMANVPDLRALLPKMPDVSGILTARESTYQATQAALQPLVAQQSENFTRVIRRTIEAHQFGLDDDKELAVYCHVGPEVITVHSFQFPNWNVAVIEGVDAENRPTTHIVHVEAMQITCKVVDAEKNKKREPIGFVMPKE